jgi:hypothetical protein
MNKIEEDARRQREEDWTNAPSDILIRGPDRTEAELLLHEAGHVSVTIRQFNEGEMRQLTWANVVDSLTSKSSSAVREVLSAVMKRLPFEAYFWECAPLSAATTQTRLFEFVAMRAHNLVGIEVDQVSFSEHLSAFTGQPVSKMFNNLGGDASLIAPAAALDDVWPYAHAATFFRHAPAGQLDAQWQTLGKALNKLLWKDRPETVYWVSTEGTGTHWLHMRLDSRPKYYHHWAFRSPTYGILRGAEELTAATCSTEMKSMLRKDLRATTKENMTNGKDATNGAEPNGSNGLTRKSRDKRTFTMKLFKPVS